jgi:hypothetical protein
MVKELLDMLGNLGEQEDDDDSGSRKKRGKHEDEGDEEEDFSASRRHKGKASHGSGNKIVMISVVFGVIVLVLIGVIAYLLLR